MSRPPKSRIVLPALVLAAFVAGRLSLAEETPQKTVKAQRYSILWADSAMDFSHGGGRWVQEIYFPEKKVACALTFRFQVGLAKPRPQLHAYPARGPRNDLTGLNGKPSAIEEIEVPADVAEEIFRFAELSRRQERESERLGRAIATRGLMKELPRARGPGSK